MKSILTNSGRFSLFFALVVFLAVSTFGQPGSGQIKLRRALDYDNDGKADFSVFRPSEGLWYIFQTNGGFQYQRFGAANTDYIAPGDFDGDGKGDISIWRDTDGNWWRLNSSTNTTVVITFGVAGDEPVQRDYDGDGKTDIAVIRRTGGYMVWYILRSTDNGYYAIQFGANTDYSAPGDYDGDGKFDLAIQRPGATAADPATFWIQRSSDFSYVAANLGLSNDLVVPGDYDGDGKTDLAVVREGATPTTPLIWEILQSSTGTVRSEIFGVTGTDINAQNDYDGDGKADIAIWRDTDGTFWIRRSTDRVDAAVQWGKGSDFPIASYDTH